MENPASWKMAERVINDALRSVEEGLQRGMIGWSAPKQIAEALRQAGLLHDEGEPEIGRGTAWDT